VAMAVVAVAVAPGRQRDIGSKRQETLLLRRAVGNGGCCTLVFTAARGGGWRDGAASTTTSTGAPQLGPLPPYNGLHLPARVVVSAAAVIGLIGTTATATAGTTARVTARGCGDGGGGVPR
jgi:hypothetical protein